MSLVYIASAAGVVALIWATLSFNGLVRASSRVDESWSGVEVQLQRRHDLVPNLVETVRGYADHEGLRLREVSEARAAAMSVRSCGRRELAEGDLSRALAGVRVLIEQYPELRASDGFIRLQSQLTEVEVEIQAARRIYNTNVQSYNERVQTFPASLVAGWGAFRPRRFFDLTLMPQRATREVVTASARPVSA
jgi:LemA protein